MRSPVFALLLLAGCGSVRLGDEEATGDRDFDAAGAIDGGLASELDVLVTVSPVDAGCRACMELGATASGGTPPYTFEWKDGIKLARRDVCVDDGQDALYVVATDAVGRKSSQHWVRVNQPQQDCVDASVPKLCLKNGSFEGTVAFNSGMSFDAPPWSDCTSPSRGNFPQVANETQAPSGWIAVPKPTDGASFLGLQEGNQASQPLCEPVAGGERRYFRLDARKLDISNATGDNSEQIFLSAWNGAAANCATQELLWVSPPLGMQWQTFCVEVTPKTLMDRLILKAISDDSQIAYSFLIADNLVPVTSCP